MKVLGKENSYEVEINSEGAIALGGAPVELDIAEIKDGVFHVIRDNEGFDIEVLSVDYQEKKFVLSINGNRYELEAKNKFDLLLDQLGMSNMAAVKADNLKAPMPGLVLKTLVEPGTNIQKGDALLVLEAMKMENIIKSPTDAVVQSIDIEVGQAVEKNQVLITFE